MRGNTLCKVAGLCIRAPSGFFRRPVKRDLACEGLELTVHDLQSFHDCVFLDTHASSPTAAAVLFTACW